MHSLFYFIILNRFCQHFFVLISKFNKGLYSFAPNFPMNKEFLHISSPSLISMKQGTTPQSELQVIHMKRTTKKLLLRAGTMTAALGITLGAAVYSTHKLPPTVPASISGDEEPQVIILDAGHGGWA